MLAKLSLVLRTVRHLRPIQVQYQLWYRLKRLAGLRPGGVNKYGSGTIVGWSHYIWNNKSYGGGRFEFLNRTKRFEAKVDWNCSEHGKLWLYNLNYFDFLNQEDIGLAECSALLSEFVDCYNDLQDGLEPYPTSIRIINLIKYVNRVGEASQKIDQLIGADTNRLCKTLEYQLLANHLLENAYALYFASCYFRDEKLYVKAKRLLLDQLKEQILEDGGHYELSAMYHQLMLYRVLDCIQLARRSQWKEDEVLSTLESYASKMIGWLNNVTFSNGDIPLFNDAAVHINPSTQALSTYCNALGISEHQTALDQSGYRKYVAENYELICDVGNMNPSYQPGHSHADSLGFILYADAQPLLVEAATATYDHNERRKYERSTQAHNTVVVNNTNSSEVWSSFRIGNRAKTVILQESQIQLVACHDGYKKSVGISHVREWDLGSSQVTIIDDIGEANGQAYFHLDYRVKITVAEKNKVELSNATLAFRNAQKVDVVDYEQALGMNHTTTAKAIKVQFYSKLETYIHIHEN